METIFNAALHGVGGVELVEFGARVATGFFFAASGFHKLFNRERHASLVETLRGDKIPLIGFNQWFVPAVEFSAGLAVMFGLLTVLAALGLLVICTVATVTDGLKRVAEYHPIDAADYADDVLYLPEVLYIFLLGMVVVGGPGRYSLDWLLATLLF